MTQSNFRKITKLSASVILALGVAHNVQAADEAFEASMKLLAPIVITEGQALSFADSLSGSASDVTTAAADTTAAIFSATGEATRAVTGSVVETSITMITGDGVGTTKQIDVDGFTTGGNLDAAGAGTFDGTGNLTNMRVGAVAHVLAEDIAGDYAGTATFRLVYQ